MITTTILKWSFFMELDNDIEDAIKGVLKNPILSVLREINIVQLQVISYMHWL